MTGQNMKRLGDYIRPVDVRNRDLKVTRLMGINIEKRFMPSVANVVGTDLSNYKVVLKGQFACNLMHVGRDEKIPVALQKDDEPIIVSPAYVVFEVVDTNVLLTEYLMMWFSRSEFDRNAWFYTDGDVRGGMDRDALFDMQIPVPAIEKQREIVAEYNTLATRIETNKKLIATLEQTAQTLYRHTFVDNIDPNNLPSGWRMGVFTDLVKIGGGGTPSTSVVEYWQNGDVPFYAPGDKTNEYYSLETEKHITQLGLSKCSSKLYPQNTTFVTARGATTGGISLSAKPMAMNQTCFALLPLNSDSEFYTHQVSLETLASLKTEAIGATFEALTTIDFQKKAVVVPPIEIIRKFNAKISPLYSKILLKQKENQTLTQMQTLLLSKMGV